MALRTLDCSLSVAIINLLGEGGNHQPDPEGTFLLGAKGDILTGLQQGGVNLDHFGGATVDQFVKE